MTRRASTNLDRESFPAMLGGEISQEQREKAAEVLESYGNHGRLGPIPGWHGSILDGYLDILGLNGREPVGNGRFNMGVQSAMPPGTRVPRERGRPKGSTAASNSTFSAIEEEDLL